MELKNRIAQILHDYPTLNHYGFVSRATIRDGIRDFSPKRIEFLMELIPYVFEPCPVMKRTYENSSVFIREAFREGLQSKLIPDVTTGEVTLAMICLGYRPHLVKNTNWNCKFKIQSKFPLLYHRNEGRPIFREELLRANFNKLLEEKYESFGFKPLCEQAEFEVKDSFNHIANSIHPSTYYEV
jgi:hypothetical protein